MTAADTHRAILAVWRVEHPRLITSLARMLRDVTLAEDITQEALVAALENWPRTGVPERPGAWLMTTAKRRALDHLKHLAIRSRKHGMIIREIEEEQVIPPDHDERLDDDIGDEMLRLVFTACHPLISRDSRVALTLKMICGLTTEEIARAFLLPEATVAQRILRAKRTLSESGLAYETPHGEELPQRLSSVLDVIYLIFNEGYTAARGENLLRPQLCHEALRLGRLLTAVVPTESEAYGLLALMELNVSRTAARTNAAGEPVPLLEQDRTRWDRFHISRGLQALKRVGELGGEDRAFALQAAIVSCHAQATRAEETDWCRIAALYRQLAEIQPSPVVELNRAVAVGMAEGSAAALAIIDGLLGERQLQNYHLLQAVRGDLLFKLGRFAEAETAFVIAAGLTANGAERTLLARRAAEAAAATVACER